MAREKFTQILVLGTDDLVEQTRIMVDILAQLEPSLYIMAYLKIMWRKRRTVTMQTLLSISNDSFPLYYAYIMCLRGKGGASNNLFCLVVSNQYLIRYSISTSWLVMLKRKQFILR